MYREDDTERERERERACVCVCMKETETCIHMRAPSFTHSHARTNVKRALRHWGVLPINLVRLCVHLCTRALSHMYKERECV